jgi:hypothetical protein
MTGASMTTHTHDYSVSPGDLLDALSDKSYLLARHERFAGVGEPTVEQDGDSVVVTAVRQLPMDKIPGPVKGLVGDGQITQVDTWSTTPDGDGTLSGTWTADLGTSPAVIGGEYEISSSGDGCTYSCSVNVKVKVPFIGGKIEEQVRGYLDRLITKEQDFLADWLTQH